MQKQSSAWQTMIGHMIKRVWMLPMLIKSESDVKLVSFWTQSSTWNDWSGLPVGAQCINLSQICHKHSHFSTNSKQIPEWKQEDFCNHIQDHRSFDGNERTSGRPAYEELNEAQGWVDPRNVINVSSRQIKFSFHHLYFRANPSDSPTWAHMFV